MNASTLVSCALCLWMGPATSADPPASKPQGGKGGQSEQESTGTASQERGAAGQKSTQGQGGAAPGNAPSSPETTDGSEGTPAEEGTPSTAAAQSTADAAEAGQAPAGATEASPAQPAQPAQPPGPPETAPPGMGAEGGAGLTPLPPPPPSEDPRLIAQGPWRGRFWFGARLDLVVPLGGEQPSKGQVVAVGGGFLFGWRINNWLGLHTGLSTVTHSAEEVRLVDSYGNTYTGIEYGQLLAFELVGARLYWPLRGRFQPYLDVTGGPSLLFQPERDSALVGGFGTAGLGFDGWVSPNFTLGVDVDYRLMGFAPEDDDEDGTLGHGIRMSAHLGVHW